jgi:hypothetical protein
MAGATHPAGRLAGGLHGWKQEGHKDTDNRDHDQQFDQREAEPGPGAI